ncbi:MAG: DUF488 family protein [Candidatus Poribacteria bacterium]|nr:DUF488 family protein [Candidatus Poribacteria bacterium]
MCKADVDTFCDIRSRRGVRGATYAFANSKRLQARLAELGIRYIHRKDLGPTKAVREKQAAADKATKTAKRNGLNLEKRLLKLIMPNALMHLILKACLTS